MASDPLACKISAFHPINKTASEEINYSSPNEPWPGTFETIENIPFGDSMVSKVPGQGSLGEE